MNIGIKTNTNQNNALVGVQGLEALSSIVEASAKECSRYSNQLRNDEFSRCSPQAASRNSSVRGTEVFATIDDISRPRMFCAAGRNKEKDFFQQTFLPSDIHIRKVQRLFSFPLGIKCDRREAAHRPES
jgi:hypothetical protein